MLILEGDTVSDSRPSCRYQDMTGTTVFTVVLCLTILTARYLLSSGLPCRPSKRRWLKTARILGSAALALAAIGYTLERQAFKLDGQTGHEPSLIERIVLAFSR